MGGGTKAYRCLTVLFFVEGPPRFRYAAIETGGMACDFCTVFVTVITTRT
jgi:hypothetical protein